MNICHILFQIQNLTTRAMIVGSLVTKEGDKPHPFKLVGNSCEEGIVKKTVDPKSPKAKLVLLYIVFLFACV